MFSIPAERKPFTVKVPPALNGIGVINALR